MRGVNQVTLLGNVGNDVEIKYTQDGTAIAKLSLATTEKYKGRDGNMVEATEWHRLVAFGKLAEIIGEYVKKGDPLFVQGSIKYGSYEKDGVKHYTTDIKLSEMRLLSSGGERTQQPRQPAQRREPAPAAKFDDVPFDDDIPF